MKVAWAADRIAYEVAEFPPGAGRHRASGDVRQPQSAAARPVNCTDIARVVQHAMPARVAGVVRAFGWMCSMGHPCPEAAGKRWDR